MSGEQRGRPLLGDALAVGAAILAFALVVLVDSHPGFTGPDDPLQALAGTWTLNPKLSGALGEDGAARQHERQDAAGDPRDEGAGAATLRIEVDSPLVMIAGGGSEVRSLYLGGPPVERPRGRVEVTVSVFRTGTGLALSSKVPAGPTFTEVFRVEAVGGSRLLRALEMPAGGAGEAPTHRLVYDRTGELVRPGLRSSLPVATIVVALALALVFAVERVIPGADVP